MIWSKVLTAHTEATPLARELAAITARRFLAHRQNAFAATSVEMVQVQLLVQYNLFVNKRYICYASAEALEAFEKACPTSNSGCTYEDSVVEGSDCTFGGNAACRAMGADYCSAVFGSPPQRMCCKFVHDDDDDIHPSKLLSNVRSFKIKLCTRVTR